MQIDQTDAAVLSRNSGGRMVGQIANVRAHDDTKYRLPPHSREAERSLLGLMLRDNSIIDDLNVTANDFHSHAHELIFRAIVRLNQEGIGADIVTVAHELLDASTMDDVGMPYLAELHGDAPNDRNHAAYEKIIADLAGLRSLIHIANDLQARADDPTASYAELMEDLQGWIRKISDGPHKIKPISLREMVTKYPTMRSPIIEGLLRDGETMNVIAAPKMGKSWFVGGTAATIALGRPWMGHETSAGRVLIIDNELHPETLADRLKRIGEAYGCLDEILDRVEVLSMRGELKDLFKIGNMMRGFAPGAYRLVIVDAFYRTMPAGVDENKNADITGLYNLIDSIAARQQCAFAFIHHATKGNQSAKGVTDVGSGAGSQSRAADTHLILRPHQEENVVVLEAVVRSFPPVQPKCLRWNWPFFTVAEGLDPAELAETNRRKRPKEATAGERDERDDARVKKDQADDTALLIVMERVDPNCRGHNFTQLRALAKLPPDRMTRAVERLKGDGIIEEVPDFKMVVGNGAKVTKRALRKCDIGNIGRSSDE